MRKILPLIPCFFLFSTFTSSAQIEQKSCGQDRAMKELFRLNPFLYEKQLGIERNLQSYLRISRPQRRGEEIITLPVVFHVIHNNGPENVADATVLAGLQHLNEAFANAGYYNPATGVDTKIQFCLAQRDPNGNSTTGINRVVSSYTNTNGVNNYSEDIALKNVSRWNPQCYINIWVVANITGSVAGYAYLPSAHGDNVDGIVLESKYIGSSHSNDVVLIHEMGHYLGLYHTFEDGCRNYDCTIDGDRVCDTPPDNSVASVGCSTPINSCSTDILSGFSTDQNDQKENFMDYGNWNCMEMFTQGQKERMRWHIENVRSSLLSCRSCLSPCPATVIGDFTSSATTITVGTTVNFTNSSSGASSYEWFIDGVSRGVTRNFNFQFSTAGTYVVKMVAYSGNAALCDNGIKLDTIYVTCPVRADFTANAIEITPTTTVTFTNNSTGGPTSYQWSVDGVQIGSAPGASYNFTIPGEHSVKLIVSNGICTSVKEILISVYTPCSNDYFEKVIGNNDLYNILPIDIEQLPDSSFIGCARMLNIKTGTDEKKGYVARHSKKGNIEWAKLLTGTNGGLLIYDMERLHDGTFVYIGESTSSATGFFVVKMTADGTIIWEKNYVFDATIASLHLYQTHIEEAPDFSLVISLAAQHDYLGKTYVPVIGRLTANGDIIWLKKLIDASTTVPNLGPRTVVADQNAVYWFLDNPDAAFIVKLNLETGSIIFKKRYVLVTPRHNNLRFREAKLKDNIIRILGANPSDGMFHEYDSIKHLMIHIDTFGTFQKVAMVKLDVPGNDTYYRTWYDEQGTITASGDFIFAEAPMFSETGLSIYRGDINGNTVYSKTIGISNRPRRIYKVKEGIYGNLIIYGSADYASIDIKTKYRLYNGRVDGEVGGTCSTAPLTFTKPAITIRQDEFANTGYTDYTLTPDPGFHIISIDPVLSVSLLCGPPTTNCYKIQVEGRDTVCGITDSITYIARRNQECTDSVKWSISPATYGSRILSDSSIRVRFSQYGDYRIIGALKSCEILTDTFSVNVSRSSTTLNIGPDDELCELSTYTMKAGPGFKSYRWQDGSIDSTFTAYTTGTFHVTVTDYCSNTKSDTIVISQAPAVPFELGNDLMYCSNDTVTITAPAGFIDYSWASPYNISSTSGRVVKVWPSVDTIYTVIAKVAEGCIVIDSVRVGVGITLPLELGEDIKFCAGESAVLDAGPGFDSYEWNTGSINNAITVNSVGTYSIKAIAADGCASKDTVIVTNVFTPRRINLGADTTICDDAPHILNAGQGFASYEWSTGAITSQIDVTVPGTYWVEVSDVTGCVSKDTINIKGVIQCKKAIYFPKAFTPNEDNLNDLFRPGVYGVLKKYHLEVYNRWGQKIFESNDPGKGWDGRIGGSKQSTANFVWFATYQFEGELPASAKGTVVLIR